MNSIWTENAQPVRFPALQGDLKTDVLIIGGGMAGILCAYMLQNAGVDCALVEARELCSGITKNTAAKITLQHGLIYHRLIKQFGTERAALYLDAQDQAMKAFSRLCEGLSCDYETQDSYVYSLNDPAKIEKEVKALTRLGLKAEFSHAPELPFKVAGAVRVPHQAQFHPLKFAYSIAKDLPIYENTKVLSLAPYQAVTDKGTIRCKKMGIATHFPLLNKHGGYSLKLYQHRSYVLALKGVPAMDGMYVDEDLRGLSFRHYGDLLLLGGGSHRTGKKGENWQELKNFAHRYYPQGEQTAQWATQDCMTLDGIPYIGQYARSTPDLYVATGFNKWGMTSSMVSALLLTDLIQGKQNEYSSLFSPSRSVLHPQLAANIFESAIGLLTPTVPRCPHLGCALNYNPHEHSWDCPCHGSRFTSEGQLIDNPATDDKHE